MQCSTWQAEDIPAPSVEAPLVPALLLLLPLGGGDEDGGGDGEGLGVGELPELPPLPLDFSQVVPSCPWRTEKPCMRPVV